MWQLTPACPPSGLRPHLPALSALVLLRLSFRSTLTPQCSKVGMDLYVPHRTFEPTNPLLPLIQSRLWNIILPPTFPPPVKKERHLHESPIKSFLSFWALWYPFHLLPLLPSDYLHRPGAVCDVFVSPSSAFLFFTKRLRL